MLLTDVQLYENDVLYLSISTKTKDPLGKGEPMFLHWALHHDNWIGSDVIRIIDRLKQHVLRLALGANTLFGI